ncbi:MAG TPA: glycerate kinase [Pseudogracilibacillus sp.]|nr:glycerate kinase [Pseudogracilibacillus sp.]
MKIVVAPDSFKGSLSSLEVANVMEKSIATFNQAYDVIKKPMADGGEGMLDCLSESIQMSEVIVRCTGPLGRKINASYKVTEQGVAFIEVAQICGLTLVPANERNPEETTTYGVGEVILDAINRGCQTMIIGLGGSATNDAGLGMLQALGVRAYDDVGQRLNFLGRDIFKVNDLDVNHLDNRLKQIKIKVASDVKNPLCGESGATYVFGRQKGATEEQIETFDQSINHFRAIAEREFKKRVSDKEGAGAAGGLGFALLLVGASITSGAQLIAEAIDLERAIKQADFVFTGEGKSDEQTFYGKAPSYVASLGKKYNVPVILLSGSVPIDGEELSSMFSGCFSILNEPLSLEESMSQVKHLLSSQMKNILHLLQSIDG